MDTKLRELLAELERQGSEADNDPRERIPRRRCSIWTPRRPNW